MVRSLQPWLPKLKEKVPVVKKNPQPRAIKRIDIKKFEILHHPFDLRFRGRINLWLIEKSELEDQGLEARGQSLEKTLNNEDWEIVKLYFFPQGKKKKWLNQDEILSRCGFAYKKKLREKLVKSLLKIWQEVKK